MRLYALWLMHVLGASSLLKDIWSCSLSDNNETISILLTLSPEIVTAHRTSHLYSVIMLPLRESLLDRGKLLQEVTFQFTRLEHESFNLPC